MISSLTAEIGLDEQGVWFYNSLDLYVNVGISSITRESFIISDGERPIATVLKNALGFPDWSIIIGGKLQMRVVISELALEFIYPYVGM